jgi:hypothetical protein
MQAFNRKAKAHEGELIAMEASEVAGSPPR